MNFIEIKSPTRVDLAGGTLDLWPLFALLGSCKTVNLAINIFTSVRLEPQASSEVRIVSHDLHLDRTFDDLSECLKDSDEKLLLVRTILNYFRPAQGFTLHLHSESPVGGGLGGSSSLVISCLKAFHLWQKQNLSVYELVTLAHNLEAQILHTPTGTQDYFPAISGGLNILEYDLSGVKQHILDIDLQHLAEHLLLVDTGKSHHSGLNNWQVYKNVVEKNTRTLEALEKIRTVSDKMAQACRKENWSCLPQLFQKEYEARIQLAPSFSSPEIERLQEVSLRAGAEGVKICGAGGGGSVLVWCGKNKKEQVIDACQKSGFHILDARPVALLK